ncbi:MAG: hypothetical protein LBK50_01050 [Candidatus Nomurabacteria bacterium]|jgi:hypothetical protein|nr:hypothetical protein [Candidatus Nomurabacteria bacterium]
MIELDFTYDIEKDVDKYVWAFIEDGIPSYGRDMTDLYSRLLPRFAPPLDVRALKQQDSATQRKNIKEYITKNLYRPNIMDVNAQALRRIWSNLGPKYTARLKKYFKISVVIAEPMTCYFTTITINPHGTDDFFVTAHNGLASQTKTIMHETMHLVFLKHFREYLEKNGLNEEQIQNIKEALVELLNLEFKDLTPVPETDNKPSTVKLKQLIKENYDKVDFEGLLKLLIKEEKRKKTVK